MHILVDADACPKVIKEIIFRAAMRLKIKTTCFANHAIPIPRSHFIKQVHVMGGFDVADQKIIELCEPNDLVITADIPLAALVIQKGAFALNPRGELYTKSNIGQRLKMRNMMDALRGAGENTGGPPPMNKQDQQAFGNALDRFLVGAKHL
ncbi:MAG: YaiI/YqxD family protein [Gammaproteobacteria bacterium]